MDFDEKVSLVLEVQSIRNLLGIKANESYMPLLKRAKMKIDLGDERQVRQVHQVMRGDVTEANKDLVRVIHRAVRKHYG